MKQAELEQEILDFWRKNKVFETSTQKKSPEGDFIFYEGPPTANGKPGIHHVLARSFKDLIPRYKTMKGYKVVRKAGWDTHGLPVEIGVEKKLGISGKKQIESLKKDKFESIKYFNEECRKSVWEYKEEWEKLTQRMGFWVDMENPYATYDKDYVESLWWVIKQVWDKDYLYQDYKVLPYCPRCGTALSSHEVAQGYKDKKSNSIYVKFKLKPKQKIGDFTTDENTYILSWTTTPWTLPGNVALAVGEGIEYVVAKNNGENIILAKNILDKDVLEISADKKKLNKITGKTLIGLEYEPLFPGAIPQSAQNYKNAFKIYNADFVNTEDGTGIVHTAVMYGEDDYNLGQAQSLPKHHTVDEEGKFDFSSQHNEILKKLGKLSVLKRDDEDIAESEKIIFSYLKENNFFFAKEKYTHTYPHCWRCDTALLYYAKSSWYIAVRKLRDKLAKNNSEINWHPEYIKNGRFGNWLSEAKDWAFSRERYWGTPLPIWVCQDCDNKICVGSYGELARLEGKERKDFDPHRPFVDEIKINCQQKDCQGKMNRVSEVVDVWFDSGAMPYAQYHYPFGEKDNLPYPADYICEAIDQTRGWFYTLLTIATLLDKKAPYKNVISLGHILDKDGQKMSKSKGNIIDPWTIFEKHGADVLRWHFFSMNNPGEAKNFDENDLLTVKRRLIMMVSNLFNFYQMYSDKPSLTNKAPDADHILDKWILSSLNKTIVLVSKALDDYDITAASREIEKFINDDISTWYLRRSRERFKASSDGVKVFGYVLGEVAKILAPFTPFIAEDLHKKLGNKDSVHLSDWPKAGEVDKDLISTMHQVREFSETIHSLRSQAGFKVRQPLATLALKKKLSKEAKNILLEEVNIQEAIILNADLNKENWLISEDAQVAINKTLTPQLRELGDLRELIRLINSVRKKQGLTPGDKVKLTYQTDSVDLKNIFTKFEKEIKESAGAAKIKESENSGQDLTVGDSRLKIALAR